MSKEYLTGYPMNDYRDYIEHHGIMGMKWGVQNGPPYPLGASDHSASEKKAGWRQSLKENSNNDTPIGVIDSEINDHLSPGFVKQLNDFEIEALNKNKKKLFQYADKDLRKSGFSESEISNLRKSKSGEYHDAFEYAFEKFRDSGAFKKAVKQEEKRFYDSIDGSKSPYVGLPKNEKIAKETEFIKRMTLPYEEVTVNDNNAATKYFNHVCNNFVDWYFSDPKTDKYRLLLEKYNKADDRIDSRLSRISPYEHEKAANAWHKARRDLLENVIKDLGFEVTPESLEFAEMMVFYD